MDMITGKWPFDSKNYPALGKLDGGFDPDEQVARFAINHIVKHQLKAMGKLAEVMEPFDHGHRQNFVVRDRLDEAVVKSFINAVRLASMTGFSAQKLMEACAEILRHGESA